MIPWRRAQRITGSLAQELKELPEKVDQEHMTTAVQRLFHLPTPERALAGTTLQNTTMNEENVNEEKTKRTGDENIMSTQPPNSYQNQDSWTSVQAYLLAVFCLALGVALGYLFRGSASPLAEAASAASPASAGAPASAVQPTPARQKEMVDHAVAPLLATLQSNPDDFDTIVKVANLYYDGQQYPDAINYYARALKLQPTNADVLTDFGTSYWYAGDADRAIAEFQAALKSQPGRASTLFNLGIVRWQGKNDPKGAVQAWEELLQKNPDYPDKQKLQEFIERAEQHAKG